MGARSHALECGAGSSRLRAGRAGTKRTTSFPWRVMVISSPCSRGRASGRACSWLRRHRFRARTIPYSKNNWPSSMPPGLVLTESHAGTASKECPRRCDKRPPRHRHAIHRSVTASARKLYCCRSRRPNHPSRAKRRQVLVAADLPRPRGAKPNSVTNHGFQRRPLWYRSTSFQPAFSVL